MSLVGLLILAIICLLLLINLLLLVLPLKAVSISQNPSVEKPFVSVLLACRNEKENVVDCLGSLLAQEYPSSRFEILVGDDQSDDETFEFALQVAKVSKNIRVFTFDKPLGNARGKSNVLAQLAHLAKGELFLITDADIRHPKSWMNFMVAGSEKLDILTGMTITQSGGFFGRFQRLDWILALGMVKVVSDHFFPVTSMGNNMLIKRDAYFKTGGYENLPFSITEDFQILRKVVENGGRTQNAVFPQITCVSKPSTHFLSLMHQRKRWMTGAIKLPLPMVLILVFQAMFFPAIIILAFIHLPLALILLGLKMIVQSLFMVKIAEHCHVKIPVFDLFWFEIYSAIVSLSSLIFFILPVKINWKGRRYIRWKKS
jgi:cellulose synthase/poly-beta-1,6-N-acetylglucosamine synthase-like glycosyltransferase